MRHYPDRELKFHFSCRSRELTDETAQPVEAIETKKGFVVRDSLAVEEFREKGYGEENKKDGLILTDYEALYLMYTLRLKVLTKTPPKKKAERPSPLKDIPFEKLVEDALHRDKSAWTKFLIYRDLRSRGYAPKEGFGFGADFRVYDRGEFGNKPAKFVVFGLNEGTEISIASLSDAVKQIARMGKVPIAAVVERRGEVIYYRVSKARFHELG